MCKSSPKRTAIALAIAGLFCCGANAEPITWNTNTDGFWDIPGNWNPGLPTTTSDVGISFVAPHVVTHRTGSDTISTVATNGNATLLINGLSTLSISSGGTNAGTIQAGGVSAGTLNLNGGVFTNTGGFLNADVGGLITFDGVNVVGGTLNSTGTGKFAATSNGNNILNGVTLNGTVDATSIANSRARIGNGMTLNGNVNIANGGVVSLDSTLGAINNIGGTGTFNLNDGNARLALEGNGSTTLGTNIVVRGQGNVGAALIAGGTNNLTNNGRISADVVGGTLTIVPGAGSGNFTNNGLVDARSGGTLLLSTNINNTAGQIAAQTGSIVRQNGVTVGGGSIATGGTGTFQAVSSTTNFLDAVNFSGTLDLTTVANARERIINGATINGAVNIANGGILSLDSSLTAGGAQTIGGTAIINLNDAAAHLSIDGTGSTTLTSGITVRGQGSIGSATFAGGTNTLTNNGLISADVGGRTLEITSPAGSGSFINNNTLQAVNGATLQLSTNVTSNAGSQIIAGTGGTVLQNGVKLNGVIDVSGGNFRATSSTYNVLDAVNFAGTLDLTTIPNARQQIVNGATINGAVNIANGGILSLNSASTTGGNQIIGGTAVINLNDAAAHLSIDGTGSTTLTSGITVRGQGSIGSATFAGGTNTLTNNGLISADVNGGTLNITAPGNSGSFINNSTLQAINGATLQLSTNITANAGSQIIAGTGGTVLQNGVKLNGVIDVSGGNFKATSSTYNVLDAVNFAGTLDLTTIPNARQQIVNGAVINGAVNIANGGILSLNSASTTGGNQTIGGTAVINLNDAAAHLSIDGTGSTTLTSGITVRGQGSIGSATFAGGTNTLTNNGLISADVNGGTLNITAPGYSGSFINNNTLQAINGATLQLSTNITANAGSQIIAGAGSAVVQNGVAINGVVNASGTGVFTATSNGNNVLNNIDFTGTLDLASIANARERIINGATLNGAINVANGGILSLDSSATSGGVQTIGGTAVINLNDANTRLSIEGNGSTTLSSGITVRGQGNIGVASIAGGTNTLTNNGLISADVGGGTLEITRPAGSGSFINNNTLQAVNGATLLLSTSINNAAGQISAQNGSSIVQNGVTLSGGTLTSSGTGSFRAISSGSNFLDNVTLGGTLDMTTTANSREQIINGATLNGAVNIANGGILSLNSASSTNPNQIIGGTGVINLNDPGARLSIEGNGSTTLAAGLTVRGQGNIGQAIIAGGTNTLLNNGTILADGGTLTILAPANNGTLAGTGTLQTSGGTLNLNTGSASTQGKLLMGGAGSALNLNTNNLTITSDYNNAQFGVGNAFNRRANVTGTGQILASGDVSQVISGTNVTGGTTANATLTIGNVHVGNNTVLYQIANSGTNGPALRGAIQTTGGGANISDTRLSGAGVTAGNYGPVAAGSSSGSLVVNFNAAAAGALAPLSGQAVNIVNNFDNVNAQLLSIQVGATAAAYNLAQGNATPAPVTLGNQRVGGTASQILTVANTAPSGSFTEGLNAGFGATTGSATNNGGVISLLAGGGSSTAMAVGVNTGSAGAKSGTVTLNYVSDGSNTSGLGTTNVGSQAVTVSGDVYRLAQGSTTPSPIAFSNHHVGDVVSQTLTVQNTAAADGYSERLNASFGANTGAATHNGGSISQLTAGGTNSSTMAVSLDTSSAGTKSGSVTVNYVSDGAGTSGLAAIGAGNQTVNVSGNVYRLASANNLGAVSFGNVHVGDTVQQALSITNTAVNDGFSEKLNASFGAGSDARITTSGSISQLAAGTSSNSMIVGLNTTTAGAVSGTQVVNFASDGTGTSGLGITALAAQTVGVSGNITTNGSVFSLASASPATPNPVNFGNVRINTATDQALSISNTAANNGFSEKLNASISTNGAPVTASGAFNLLGPQSTDNGSLHVGINTSSAGAKSGSATIALVSDGTGTSGLGTTNLLSQTVNVSGDVYRLANPTLNTPSVTIAARVGDLVSTNQAVSVSNTSPDIYTEGLKVAVAGTGGNAQTNGGSIANLAAQGTNNSAILVGLASTAVAGTTTGQVNLNLVSTGTGTTGASDLSVGTAVVNVLGNVYQQAVAMVNTAAVSFGIVHVGDNVAARNVAVTNNATSAGLNDVLKGSISASGPFSASGTLGAGLGAGATNTPGSLTVGFSTVGAGLFTGHALLAFASSNTDMIDLALANEILQLSGQVNNYAKADIQKTGGAGSLSRSGNTITLNLGTLIQGTGSVHTMLEALNNVNGLSDLLQGTFDLTGANDFSLSGFGAFSGLAAGGADTGLDVGFDTSVLGLFSDQILLAGTGYNQDGYNDAQNLTLLLTADVVASGSTVPEPRTLPLLAVALAALLLARRRSTLH